MCNIGSCIMFCWGSAVTQSPSLLAGVESLLIDLRLGFTVMLMVDGIILAILYIALSQNGYGRLTAAYSYTLSASNFTGVMPAVVLSVVLYLLPLCGWIILKRRLYRSIVRHFNFDVRLWNE